MSTPLAAPQSYRNNAILSASPSELVVELYDGARRFLLAAGQAFDERQIERGHHALLRAERIIKYLDDVIDYEQGEIAENLHALYTFYLEHLSDARTTQDRGKIEAVSKMLGGLGDAWREVARHASG